MLISTATSTDEATRSAKVAVLPVGSFEQHGSHLPLSTDTLIAATIAHRIATDYRLLLLPPRDHKLLARALRIRRNGKHLGEHT